MATVAQKDFLPFYCRASFEYTAEDQGELGFKEGQILKIIGENEFGWWLAQNGQGEVGWAPSNYLTKLTSKELEELRDKKKKKKEAEQAVSKSKSPSQEVSGLSSSEADLTSPEHPKASLLRKAADSDTKSGSGASFKKLISEETKSPEKPSAGELPSAFDAIDQVQKSVYVRSKDQVFPKPSTSGSADRSSELPKIHSSRILVPEPESDNYWNFDSPAKPVVEKTASFEAETVTDQKTELISPMKDSSSHASKADPKAIRSSVIKMDSRSDLKASPKEESSASAKDGTKKSDRKTDSKAGQDVLVKEAASELKSRKAFPKPEKADDSLKIEKSDDVKSDDRIKDLETSSGHSPRLHDKIASRIASKYEADQERYEKISKALSEPAQEEVAESETVIPLDLPINKLRSMDKKEVDKAVNRFAKKFPTDSSEPSITIKDHAPKAVQAPFAATFSSTAGAPDSPPSITPTPAVKPPSGSVDDSESFAGSRTVSLGTTESEPVVQLCHVCSQPLGGEVSVMVKAQKMHQKCFKCNTCSKSLVDIAAFEKDDRFYCRADYEELIGEKCELCKKTVVGSFVRALGKPWHSDCFVCTVCKRPFADGKFHQHNGMPYCAEHYAITLGIICDECKKPIVSGGAVKVLGRNYHRDCLRCSFESHVLDPSKPLKLVSGKLYCADHYLKALETLR